MLQTNYSLSSVQSSEGPYPACERLVTLGANKRSGDKVGVMVAFEVHIQELLLSEGLLTLAACVRFLSSVGAAMHYHVALLNDKTEFSKS